MLIERYNPDGRWRWRVIEMEAEPSCKRFSTEQWDIIIIGSYNSSMPVWIEQGIEDGKTPIVLISTVWEKYDGHCMIAFLNNKNDSVIIGVDPYAIAKVYVYTDNGRWYISSRLSEILRATSDKPPNLHPHASACFLMKGYTPARHTFYRNITKIPPGSILEIDSGKESSTCYLDIRKEATMPGKQYLVEVREAWENSLKSYLKDFESHCVALSGGIDSTLLLKSLLFLGVERKRCVARTCMAIGGDNDNIVLNPYDCEFAKRVCIDFDIRHEVIPYHWSDERVLEDFKASVRDLGSESHIGSPMFQSLAPVSYSNNIGLYAAQNADSIFSFASIEWPRFELKMPFIKGLGGWTTRYNLFGGMEGNINSEGIIAKTLLDIYLQRHYRVRMKDRTPTDRMFGMVFNGQMWPVHPNEQSWPYIVDVEGLSRWFEQEYIIGPNLMDFFKQNPHGAFVWLFLNTYMQGSANRGTAWPTSARVVPSFLPFASLGILRSTVKLIPDFRFHWFGKYAILSMARNRYKIPEYVLNRRDPTTPELDRMFFSSFFSNSAVYDYLYSFFPERAEERFSDIIEDKSLEQIIAQFKQRKYGEADIHLMFRMCWLLTLEQLAWES